MKDQARLQQKLFSLLKGHHKLKVSGELPWSDAQFKEIAWVVNDFVVNSGDVTNDDPLYSWLEEYQFYYQERNVKGS